MEHASSSRAGRFPSTRRSAVLAVGEDDPAERARAFEVLVRAYWKPVYKHVRVRWRRPAEDAGELTQAFFARAFEKRWFKSYDPARALFRTYLKMCLDRFVLEHQRDGRRKKRGGGLVHLSLDFEGAEGEIGPLPAADATAIEAAFDQEWTRSLLGDAVDALRASCAARGREAVFQVFRRYVLDDDGAAKPTYQALADELGIKVTDVTNHLAAARREFRRIVLERLRELTASEDEWRSEARAVLGIEP
jgi:RNA polymerase sigma factor (sigma-70 family)